MRGKTLAWMIVIVFGTAVAWAGFSGTEVYLPSVGSGAGAQGSSWRTALWLHNPGSTTANVTLQFLARGASNPSPATAYEVVGPGETIRVPDLMMNYFGMSSGFGALRVTSDQKVVVNARIFSTPSGGGEDSSAGQFFAGVPASFAIGPGEHTFVTGGYQFTPTASGPFRFNFGFVETTGHSATVRVTAYNGFDPSSPLGSKDYSLQGFGALQKSLTDVVSNPNGDNIVLKVEVLTGPGKVIAFGSQVANGSNDPSTFEMEYADSLLGGGSSGSGGLTQVSHDSTLTGDGTSSSPLGVADHGVTAQKLSASGSSAGQVLMSDGSTVSWQTPSGGGGGSGFSLPYAGTVSSSAAAFSVTNSGDGPAIAADSSGHDGVRAFTNTATKSGVYGASRDHDGYGIYGKNLNTGAHGFIGGNESDYHDGNSVPTGVWGRADGFSEVGVIGVSNQGTGVAGEELSTGNWGALGRDDAGVIGVGIGGGTPYAVYGSDLTGGIGFAAYFDGDVAVSGDLSVFGTKNFKIDHPLDPANRYLLHAAVESDEVLNQYTGNVTLDENGRATVTLPDWFEAVNTDFRYQLTPVGAPAPGLYIARKVQGNSFEIAGGTPGLEVSWLITARRNDRHMRAHPFQAERDKPEALRGSYLEPELYDQPETAGEQWVAHPRMMREIQRRLIARETTKKAQ